MADIFLSYAREDRDWAKAFAEALSRTGWSVWWDKIIPPGKTFDEVIEHELHAAKRVIVLWSKRSVASKWVMNEATDADERGVLLPIMIESDLRLPLAFRRLQAADLTGWQGAVADARFEELARVLAAELPPSSGRPSEPPRAPAVRAAPPEVRTSSLQYCHQCGRRIEADNLFCNGCGRPIKR